MEAASSPPSSALVCEMSEEELVPENEEIVQVKKTPQVPLPPPLPPNKPRSRPVIMKPNAGYQKGDFKLALSSAKPTSRSSSPKSCLKKQSAERFGTPAVTYLDGERLYNGSDPNNNHQDTRRHVYFSDEVDQRRAQQKEVGVGGDSVEVYRDPNIESVTTLSNVCSSGYDFLNGVFQPIAYNLKRLVSQDVLTMSLQTKKADPVPAGQQWVSIP